MLGAGNLPRLPVDNLEAFLRNRNRAHSPEQDLILQGQATSAYPFPDALN